MGVVSYKDLKVWQMGVDLVERVYKLTTHFPKHEIYGLSNQMQRSAVSIPSNIAEGQARDSTKEFLHYLSIALGSLAELETQIIVAQRLLYVSPEMTEPILQMIDEIGRMLRRLRTTLKKRLATSPQHLLT